MTIIFQKDWEKYPNAIVDTSQLNKTFLEKAYMLKQMGVKNHLFMLALHNPKLLGVDPHSPYLTVEQMAMIAVECRQNFWYAVRNVWRVPPKTGVISSPIEANRGNLAAWWAFLNHITFILTQPRQTGKTFCTNVMTADLMNFRCQNTEINLLTKDDTLRAATIRDMKDIYEELPDYLNFKMRSDVNNTEAFSVNKFHNLMRVHVPQASVKKAANAARGQTSPVFRVDEGPFQVNIRLAYPAAMAAMGAVREKAQREGEPYGISLTTTAGKRDDDSGKYIYSLVEDSALWSERFYDAEGPEELDEMVRRNSRGGVSRIYGVFSHRQLGKTDKWLKENLEETNPTPEEANRDYFNRWTSGTSKSPIPVHLLEAISNSVTPALYDQIYPQGYILYWYIPQAHIKHYLSTRPSVIGIDTSDGTGGDDISFVQRDVGTGEVIAKGKFNETNLIVFAKFLVHVLETMPLATMIIERRSSAIVIIDYLLLMLPEHGIDPFERLFNWVMNDPIEHDSLYREASLPMTRRDDSLYVRAKKYFGFATSGSGKTSRSELYSTTLMSACKSSATTVRDHELAAQITGLVDRKGRIDHQEDGNDDLVIGWLLSQWLLTAAQNLHSYGIHASEVLTEKIETKVLSRQEAFTKTEQDRLRVRIRELIKLMDDERSQVVLARYELEMRQLSRRLILGETEAFNIDTVLNQLKQKKKDEEAQARRNYYSGVR
jgi:hypothetical protein